MFYPYQQYRSRVFLPIALIRKANDEGWMPSLAYFVRLKSLYKNNTVYDFSLRKLAGMIHASPAALSHHIKVLEFHGLIRFTGKKNITFIGADTLKAQAPTSTQKLTNVTVDHKNQLTLLRGKILQFNLNQQHYVLRKSETIISPGDLRIVASNERIANYVGLSCTGFGKLIGCSKSTGQRVRDRLSLLGTMRCHRVIQIIGEPENRDHFNALKKHGIFPARAKYVDGSAFLDRVPIIEYKDTQYCMHAPCVARKQVR